MRLPAILAAVVVAASTLVFVATAGTERRAALRVTDLQPLVLEGARFGSRERIQLRVTTGSETVRRTLRASPRGTFVASFASVTVDRCNGGLSAVARGARGAFAATKVLPLPLCPPS